MPRDNKLKVDTDEEKKEPGSGAGEITRVWTPRPEKQADMPVVPKKKANEGKSKQREKRGR